MEVTFAIEDAALGDALWFVAQRYAVLTTHLMDETETFAEDGSASIACLDTSRPLSGSVVLQHQFGCRQTDRLSREAPPHRWFEEAFRPSCKSLTTPELVEPPQPRGEWLPEWPWSTDLRSISFIAAHDLLWRRHGCDDSVTTSQDG